MSSFSPHTIKNVLAWVLKLVTIVGVYQRSERLFEALLAGELLDGWVNGTWAFLGHRFKPDVVARSIGWPTGHRFQTEIAFMNAGIAIVNFHALISGVLIASEIQWPAITAAVCTHATIYFGCAEAHFESIRGDNNWATSNAGFQLLMVTDIGSPTYAVLLLMIAGSLASGLDAFQLVMAASLVLWGLHCAFRYFRDVFPQRHKVYDPNDSWEAKESQKRL